MKYMITNWETKDGKPYVKIEARIGTKPELKSLEDIDMRPMVAVEHYFTVDELKDNAATLDKLHDLLADLEILYDDAVASKLAPLIDCMQIFPKIDLEIIADKKKAKKG